jgi:hypothetical protein
MLSAVPGSPQNFDDFTRTFDIFSTSQEHDNVPEKRKILVEPVRETTATAAATTTNHPAVPLSNSKSALSCLHDSNTLPDDRCFQPPVPDIPVPALLYRQERLTMYDLLTNPIRRWSSRARLLSSNSRSSPSQLHSTESPTPSIGPPSSPTSPRQLTSSLDFGRPPSSPPSPSIIRAPVNGESYSFCPLGNQQKTIPQVTSSVQKVCELTLSDEDTPRLQPRCIGDGAEAVFVSDTELDSHLQAQPVFALPLNHGDPRCSTSCREVVADGRFDLDLKSNFRQSVDDTSESLPILGEVSCRDSFPNPLAPLPHPSAVSQDESQPMKIQDSDYSLKSPPHPRFSLFNPQTPPSPQFLPDNITRPSSPSPTSLSTPPNTGLDISSRRSRASSPCSSTPSTPPGGRKTKCSGWTEKGEPCKTPVSVDDVDAQSALSTLYPETLGEPVQRFCQKHRQTILRKTEFFSLNAGVVEFDRRCPVSKLRLNFS